MTTDTRRVLGVSDDDYNWIVEASDNRCWICGDAERVPNRSLAVDHDHRTDAVRGLLCTSCNVQLGSATNPEWFRRAANYLTRAACAFGDCCDVCHKPAPSTLLRREKHYSVFLHRCCGRTWPVTYRTRGVPFGWAVDGLPVPAFDEVAYAFDPKVGCPVLP
jgi:hypothetical protein